MGGLPWACSHLSLKPFPVASRPNRKQTAVFWPRPTAELSFLLGYLLNSQLSPQECFCLSVPWRKEKCGAPESGNARPSSGEITLVHGLAFSGVAHPRGCPPPRRHQAPISSKGREMSDQNRTEPRGSLSSQRQAVRVLALSVP